MCGNVFILYAKKSVPVVHGAFQFHSIFSTALLRSTNGPIASFQVFTKGEKQHSSNQYVEHRSNIFKTRFVFVMYVYLKGLYYYYRLGHVPAVSTEVHVSFVLSELFWNLRYTSEKRLPKRGYSRIKKNNKLHVHKEVHAGCHFLFLCYFLTLFILVRVDSGLKMYYTIL
jgi:hypothetical protein